MYRQTSKQTDGTEHATHADRLITAGMRRGARLNSQKMMLITAARDQIQVDSDKGKCKGKIPDTFYSAVSHSRVATSCALTW